jgi:hypothetical protein
VLFEAGIFATNLNWFHIQLEQAIIRLWWGPM